MKKILAVSLLFFISLSVFGQKNDLKLWYDKPAKVWNEALPIGNGRLGAMIFSDPAKEIVQLNEGTFWSGSPNNNDNPAALAALPELRSLIFAKNYSAAQTLANDKIITKKSHGAKYLPIGNLEITFPGHTVYSSYYRELDIEKALQTTTYNVGGVTYKREVFASQPDQVIVVRLSASEPGKTSFSATLNGPLKTTMQSITGNILEMTGLSSTHEGVVGQVKFLTRVKIVNTGGTITSSATKIDVANADEVLLIVSIATNFVDYQTLSDSELGKCAEHLDPASAKSYTNLLSDHTNAYQKYFKRLSLSLGATELSQYPTDIRIKNFSRTSDPGLVSLYYQFGRYLLISSSQPGGQPATLQGLWNESTNPSWDSKYTININTEMNYWPAEKTNLTEMHEPLVQMLKELSVTGHQTAQTMYGADGWVTHHNTDLWRICGPVDNAYYGTWPMGGAWLSQHLWEKFLYSGDMDYLASVYPVLKGASEFYNDFLVEEPENKWLVVCPSHSPENNPSIYPGVSITAGSTIDNQIVFDLFTKTIKAAALLKIDSALMVEFKTKLDRLPPMQIGQHSQLQEWMHDLDNPNDKNRHVSHLYGLFPSNQISAYRNPELFDAARTSLIYRGDVSTGWSMGWKVNFWARLLDGNHALKLITDQLTLVDPVLSNTGGTYPNLFDAHPPFQIDGNFGCTSGITEMLVQSHDGAIHCLPALPEKWESGEITGLRMPGGFQIDLYWENHKVKKLVVTSTLGGNCRVRVPNSLALQEGVSLDTAKGANPNPFFEVAVIKDPLISSSAKLNDLILAQTILYDLPTEAGKTYTLTDIVNPEYSHAEVNDKNPKHILVEFTLPIKQQGEYSGFILNNGQSIAVIDSIWYVDSIQTMVISLENALSKDSVISISYQNGNVVSLLGGELENFLNSPVNNLLYGSSPVINYARLAEDGNTLIATFNKKMLIPGATDKLNIEVTFEGKKSISLSQPVFYNNDSATIAFTVAEKLYADYKLSLNYTGNEIESSDNGLLKPFSGFGIENQAIGLPLQLQEGFIDKEGTSVVLNFNKAVAFALAQSSYFTIVVNNTNIPVIDFFIADSTIILYPKQKIYYGDTVKVSYAGGNITAADKGKLADFTDFVPVSLVTEPVWALIPDKLEAELYYAQSGVQKETTSDAGGGENVGYIDDGDWMEYAVNVEKDTVYETTFRLASQYGGGIIAVSVDNVEIGQVNSSNTGGWQIWESKTIDLKLKKGKHYLKIYAKKGGFNINWIQFTQKPVIISSISTDMLQLQVFPNPAKDKLFISCPGLEYKKIEIFDLTGKILLTSNASNIQQSIDVNLPDGMYLLVLSNPNQSLQQKFVIKN